MTERLIRNSSIVKGEFGAGDCRGGFFRRFGKNRLLKWERRLIICPTGMIGTVLPDEDTGACSSPRIAEMVIRIAGNSQDGIQSMGKLLAFLAGRSEQDVMTFMTIPSTISGGPSIFQVRLGSGEVLSAGDEADMLLAFYQHSYENHVDSLKEGGIVLYDSDHVEPNDQWREQFRHIGVPISGNTVEAVGGTARDKGKNMYALGLIAKFFGLDDDKFRTLIEHFLKSKGESVVGHAIKAFDEGHKYEFGDALDIYQLAAAQKRSRGRVVMTGNQALAYGLIAAGVRFGAGYPITPWSDIMELLRRELPKYGGTFQQCEDEIASVSTAIGAGYAGRVAVTGSSGPGISLKTEAIGWAIMAEVPVIVIDVQRGGPSTGMPTNVEQSDLFIACFGGHGDAPRVVLSPYSVEDCFHLAIEAVNFAKQYSVPVIILTDQAIATRIEAFDEPDLEQVFQTIAPNFAAVPEHKPYALDRLATPHLAPGTRVENGEYPIITGLEHDEQGRPTASPQLHLKMTARRRNKLRELAKTLPASEIYGSPTGKVLLVGWGATRGPIREAVDRARGAEDDVSAIHLRNISPLPPGLEDIFAGFEHVFVVEMNDEGLYGYGQLATLLRARTCNPKIRSITKTDGLTFKIKEILARMKFLLNGSPSPSSSKTEK